MLKFYTGVGSRNTPPDILGLMARIAGRLAEDGFVLRSGGAKGADLAFESGAGDLKEIYLAKDATLEAMELAGRFHPAWDRCSDFAKRLHGRNSFQVLGRNLDVPSSFLICCTADGCTCDAERSISTGGTGTAISIADYFGIEVFNLARPAHLQRLAEYVA